ncbi:glycoside hydrolase family 88/105 protein [Chitinophaga niabensis]|uniref:Rhamnogalacturonyl hydrolase YesR n=1 Tax=Chitinophaga niabensis TaxID=536979 RepID=A0A1N6G868_9BACT|nr:glycoside hydrolase family 88 protein [Chitinophaga niabensis]SIO03684.1 Rhamnogalacturonyl hydrolase YesR [Chitinophaga niabensis]
MKYLLIVACAFSVAKEMAATLMDSWKAPAKWTYEQGVVMRGMEGLWERTKDTAYLSYIKKSIDPFIEEDGTIRTYKQQDFNIDNIMPGRILLFLYRQTKEEKYKKAATTLRNQLKEHPRTKAGGFWHKKVYPWQMWLDGLYMGQPFYLDYALTFKEDTTLNDIVRQFVEMEQVSRDKKTGLLYHGYDESRQQQWADKTTGRSPHVWARAMGWYGMALVDVLELFPAKDPRRPILSGILKRLAIAVEKYQDPATGLWWDIVDLPGKGKNYYEASASCMFTYTLAKGVRLGILPAKYKAVARRAYAGILKEFIKKDEQGRTHLHGTVSVSGLGGNPYRDGSFEYYMSEKVVVDDPKGVGAFLQAANEMEMP